MLQPTTRSCFVLLLLCVSALGMAQELEPRLLGAPMEQGKIMLTDIAAGELVQYDNYRLRITDIKDSRCPAGVTCVWNGPCTFTIIHGNRNIPMQLGVDSAIRLGTVTFQVQDIVPVIWEDTDEPGYQVRLQIFQG